MFGKLFKKHPEFTLYFLAALFIGVVIGFYFFGILFLAGEFNKAVDIDAAQQSAGATFFDLQGAAALGLN